MNLFTQDQTFTNSFVSRSCFRKQFLSELLMDLFAKIFVFFLSSLLFQFFVGYSTEFKKNFSTFPSQTCSLRREIEKLEAMQTYSTYQTQNKRRVLKNAK